jgi:prepilin-type N-terminal cleavage/methylation domain-containing protein/prepilin-type processing-associated H-X9-DG protein
MVKSRWHCHGGFTLIEMLVVIAIIGVLVSLLMPAVQKVREAANRAQCQNNLKQIGTALFNYQTTNRRFPLGRTTVSSTVSYNWIVQILPYIEQDNLYRGYDFTQNWGSTSSLPSSNETSGLIGTKLSLLRCPSAPAKRNEGTRAMTDYSATNLHYVKGDVVDQRWLSDPTARQQFFENSGVLRSSTAADPKGTPVRDITDGTSNTIMVAECAGRNLLFWNGEITTAGSFGGPSGAWANPDNMIMARGSGLTGLQKGGPGATCAVNCLNKEEAYAFHPGTFNALFADTSVRPLSASVDLLMLQALITKAGSEVVNPDS